MLNFLLNRGGAGVSLSRTDTIERLNPIIRAAYPLLHRYDAVLAATQDEAVAERLATFTRTLRIDIGKLNETVLSCGGVPYNGTDLDPAAFPAPEGDEAYFVLADEERAFDDLLAAEDDVKPHHQIRSQAILGVVRANAQARLTYLDELTRKRQR